PQSQERSLSREGKKPVLRRAVREDDLTAESAAAAIIRLHLAEQLQRMLGLEPDRCVRRDLALEPTSRCGQVLVLHQVAKPAATAAAAARQAHLAVIRIGPDISLREIVGHPFRARVMWRSRHG